jgi:hypothetical protein
MGSVSHPPRVFGETTAKLSANSSALMQQTALQNSRKQRCKIRETTPKKKKGAVRRPFSVSSKSVQI